MSKRAWIIIIILIVGVFGFFLINGKADNNNNPNTASSAKGDPKKIVSDDYITGSKDHKIVLMEYFDFQCPGCKALFPVMQEARAKYGDQVTFVQRYFPLTSIHQNALIAARAGEAAGKQGKFFDMEPLLFNNQSAWETMSTSQAQKTFEGYAQQLKLNLAQFESDMASAATLDHINADRDRGNQMGVNSTPSVFLNGDRVDINSASDITNALDQAIGQNKTDPVNYIKPKP
ncbi:MAG TPA: thioredoxin domain-containing protein [Candidatus Saccharimonadales bacterium]|nr:thioredoxin domain-containing protein [Candidatus Saccharimonadales bacterium]